jgi:uncharacterized membrane protein YdjX (TVP38/TMEM64 family)
LTIFILAVVFVLIVPYLLWHEQMDAFFASEEFQQRLIAARPYAWLVGIGLIVGDLLLPVPAAPIMASMGAIYGTILGGSISALGLMLAGLCAYGASRLLGLKAARLLASEDELDDLRAFFDTWGAAGIIASRALPVVPEVMTVLAGLSRMHFGGFVLALSLGSIPVGITIAWLGRMAGIRSSVLFLLTLIPACGWCIYMIVSRRRRRRPVRRESRPGRSWRQQGP